MPDLRASHADRRAVIKMLRAAARQGRLDATEFDVRLRAAEAAKTRRQLARLHADLPSGGEKIVAPEHRITDGDRERARGWLATGLTEGRLTQAASARIEQAERLRLLDQAVAALDRRASDAERAEAVARLADYDERVVAAYAAKSLAELDPLLADLIEPEQPPGADILDYIYDRWGRWFRYAKGIPMVEVTDNDVVPPPGVLDYMLHKRVWQVVTLVVWGAFAGVLLATLASVAFIDIEVFLVSLVIVLVVVGQVLFWASLYYTYAVVRRAALRRRGRPMPGWTNTEGH